MNHLQTMIVFMLSKSVDGVTDGAASRISEENQLPLVSIQPTRNPLSELDL